MRQIKFYFMFAALTLGACVTTGPEPVVTQADRDFIYRGLDFRKQCLAVVERQPIQSVDPAKDCECVHRAAADELPAWFVRRSVDYENGTNRTTLSYSEQKRAEVEISASTIRAYRACGVVN